MKFLSHTSKNLISRFSSGTRGFTIVEVLVVITILSVLFGVLLARYKDFDSTTLLNSLAYDIAGSIREAQVLGVAVRGTEAEEGRVEFNYAYGIHFQKSNPTEYVIFVDTRPGVPDGRFGSGDIEVSRFTIGNGNSISSLCVNGTICNKNYLGITFKRPDLDAVFKTNGTSGIISGEIRLTSRTGNTRTVVVSSTGQISVKDN